MEISSELKTQAPTNSAQTQTANPTAESPKIPDGSTIKGEITDLKHDQVTIRTESGEVVTAKLDALSDAAIGQERSFTVRYSGGQLTVSINETSRLELQKNALSQALSSLGFKNTPENIKLAEMILENNLPMTKETLFKLNQALKLLGPENLDKGLFLMKNDMRLNSQNAETLNGFLSGETKIQGQLKDLLTNLDSLPGPEKNLLSEILLKGEAALGDGKLIEKLVTDIKNFAASSPPEGAVGQKIAAAFSNVNLSPEAFDKLAQELVKEFPNEAPLIEKLAGEKKVFVESVRQAASNPEAAAKLTAAIRTGTLTPELFKHIAEEAGIKMPADSLPTRSEIKYIVENLAGKDIPLKEKALEVLLPPEPGSTKESGAHQKLLSRLSFALNSGDPKEIDSYLNGLRDNLQMVKGELARLNLPESQQILRDINNINQNLEFVSQLKSNIFFQLPITVDGHDTNSELFIFKDKNKKNKQKKGGATSAMIALDTQNLGRFETYVQKTGVSVNCQFRLENKNIESLVRANLPKLEQMLKGYNYSLDNISFYTLDEPFSLMDDAGKAEKSTAGDSETGDGLSRIVFDIRT